MQKRPNEAPNTPRRPEPERPRRLDELPIDEEHAAWLRAERRLAFARRLLPLEGE